MLLVIIVLICLCNKEVHSYNECEDSTYCSDLTASFKALKTYDPYSRLKVITGLFEADCIEINADTGLYEFDDEFVNVVLGCNRDLIKTFDGMEHVDHKTWEVVLFWRILSNLRSYGLSATIQAEIWYLEHINLDVFLSYEPQLRIHACK